MAINQSFCRHVMPHWSCGCFVIVMSFCLEGIHICLLCFSPQIEPEFCVLRADCEWASMKTRGRLIARLNMDSCPPV